MKMKNVEDMYALSSMQQLMLFHALSGGADILFEQLTCTLRGPLDTAAFRASWQTVVNRHPALRTAFVWERVKKPLQIVRQQVELPWEEHDARQLDPTRQQVELEQLAAEAKACGFRLNQAPLMSCALLRTGELVHRLIWNCHHLILDGWCLGLLLGEVFACYEAFTAGREPDLPDVRPFRDYMHWLSQRKEQRAEAYWTQYLRDMRPLLHLPVEEPALASTSTAGAQTAADGNNYDSTDQYREVSFGCPANQTAVMSARASSQRVTLSTLLTAGWALLLGRYTGRDDVLLGATVSGRPPEIPGVERIIGPLMNNVPVRVRPRQTQTVADLLQEVRSAQVEQSTYEHTPLERISAWVGGRPIFDSLLVVENYPLDANRQIAGLSIEDVTGTATASHGLTLICVPGERLTLTLRYDQRRYSSDAATQLLVGFAQLLDELANRPDAKLSTLEIVPAEQRRDWLDSGSVVLDTAGRQLPVGVPGELYSGPSEQPQATGDWARRRADGSIEKLGDAKAPVRVGIYRADPAQVQQTLAGHPLVDDVVTRSYLDPQGERQLAAFLAPAKESKTVLDASEHSMLVDQLRTAVRQACPVGSVPAAFVVVDGIPRHADGTVDTAALPEPTRLRPESAGPPVVARDAIESSLVTIWEELLGVYPIGVADSFAEFGGNSTLAVSLISRIEEQFGRKLPLVSLYQEPTIENLAQLLRRPTDGEVSSLIPIRVQGNKLPLYCIHPAGGTVFCYLELARHLAADRPIFGLQAVGVEGEATPQTEVAEMAEHYRREIQKHQPGGPYLICGWSSGGILAFEVARQFEAAGQQVGLLALFDAGVQGEREFTSDDFLPMLLTMFPGESAEEIEALQDQGPEQQLKWFQRRAELAQLVVAGAAATQAQYVFEVFQANINAIAQYRPQAYGGRITLFRASEHATPMHADEDLGWGRWAKAGVDVFEVPGDHVTMFREPTIARLAEILDRQLSVL